METLYKIIEGSVPVVGIDQACASGSWGQE